jgi:hypothetical protein
MLIGTLRYSNEFDRHVQNQRAHIFATYATWRNQWPMNILSTAQHLRSSLRRFLLGKGLHLFGFNCAS